MKAKKQESLLQSLLLLLFLLTACSSQTAVPVDLPTATASQTPPPTATVIPSPTISPEVIAMQEQIAGDTKNFTLNTEGKLEYKGVTYNGLTYGEDGNWHLTLADGTEVTLAPGQVSMDDKKGFSVNSYTYDVEKGFVKNKEFKIAACTAEHIFDEKITVEDLPAYHDWLNTLSKPFDASKIKDVPLMRQRGEANRIIYDWRTAPNWEDLEATGQIAPFRRDVTCAYLEYQGYTYLVLPIEFYDKNEPTKNKWVLTVASGYWPGHSAVDGRKLWIPDTFDRWTNDMNITPIVTSSKFQDSRKPKIDPLVAKVFAEHPDFLSDGSLNPEGMEARIVRFMSGDLTGLADRGIYLLADIGTSSKHWFE